MTHQMARGSQVAFGKSWLERQNIESQTVDVHSHIDGSLSYEENIKKMKRMLGMGGRSTQQATRTMTAGECDVAIGNYEAGYNGTTMKDACECGHPDACDDLERKVAKAKAAAKPKKTPTPKKAKLKDITNNLPTGYAIRQWTRDGKKRYAILLNSKFLKASVGMYMPVPGSKGVFESLPAVRAGVAKHAEYVADKRKAAKPKKVSKVTTEQRPKVRDKVKMLGKWGYITEVRKDDVRIKDDGMSGDATLVYTDMLHKVAYRPDPIAKMSFYWLVKFPRKTTKQSPTPALIDENVALRRSEGQNLARQDKMHDDLTAAITGGFSAKPKKGLVSQKEHELGKTLLQWGKGIHTPTPAAKPAKAPKPKPKAAAPKRKAAKPKKTAAKPAKAKPQKAAPAGIALTATQKKRLAATGRVTVKRGGKFITITR